MFAFVERTSNILTKKTNKVIQMQQTTTKANDDNDTSKQSELILAKAKCKHIGDPAFAIVTTR